MNPSELREVLKIEVVDGDLAGLQNRGIAVPADMADIHGWKVGTPLLLTFLDTGSASVEVRALYDNEWLATSRGLMVSKELFNANFSPNQQTDFQVYVKLDDASAASRVGPQLEETAARFPPARVEDLTQFKRAQTRVIDQFVFFVWALLLLAVVVSFIGILNTLLLSVYERTREIGLLRAGGMTRSQVRSMIRWEAEIITLVGTLAGLSLGLFFARAIVRTLADGGVQEYPIPVAQLGVIVGGAWVASLLAAAWPARRAANLDVLAAIAEQ